MPYKVSNTIAEIKAYLVGSRKGYSAYTEMAHKLVAHCEKLEAQLAEAKEFAKRCADSPVGKVMLKNTELEAQLAAEKEARKQDQLRINPQIENLLKGKGILEAKKTATPYSVYDVHLMSEQLVRAEEKLEKVREMEVPTGYSAKFTHGWASCLQIVQQALENDDE